MRSVRRWWHAYQEAETRFGCGYLGLLDRVAQRGNRTTRIPEASMQLLQAHLQTHYAAPPRQKAQQQSIGSIKISVSSKAFLPSANAPSIGFVLTSLPQRLSPHVEDGVPHMRLLRSTGWIRPHRVMESGPLHWRIWAIQNETLNSFRR